MTSRPVIELDAAAAQLFGNPDLHTVIELVLPARNGDPVRMMTTDFLEVTGSIQLELRIDEEL